MIVLDTNLLSRLLKPAPAPQVLDKNKDYGSAHVHPPLYSGGTVLYLVCWPARIGRVLPDLIVVISSLSAQTALASLPTAPGGSSAAQPQAKPKSDMSKATHQPWMNPDTGEIINQEGDYAGDLNDDDDSSKC